MDKLNLKDKRADITITLLVLGVIVICAFAILSFLISSFFTRQDLTGISEMETLNSEINEYHFYQQDGLTEEKINGILGVDNGKISIQKTKKVLKFIGLRDKFLFSVEYWVSW